MSRIARAFDGSAIPISLILGAATGARFVPRVLLDEPMLLWVVLGAACAGAIAQWALHTWMDRERAPAWLPAAMTASNLLAPIVAVISSPGVIGVSVSHPGEPQDVELLAAAAWLASATCAGSAMTHGLAALTFGKSGRSDFAAVLGASALPFLAVSALILLELQGTRPVLMLPALVAPAAIVLAARGVSNHAGSARHAIASGASVALSALLATCSLRASSIATIAATIDKLAEGSRAEALDSVSESLGILFRLLTMTEVLGILPLLTVSLWVRKTHPRSRPETLAFLVAIVAAFALAHGVG